MIIIFAIIIKVLRAAGSHRSLVFLPHHQTRIETKMYFESFLALSQFQLCKNRFLGPIFLFSFWLDFSILVAASYSTFCCVTTPTWQRYPLIKVSEKLFTRPESWGCVMLKLPLKRTHLIKPPHQSSVLLSKAVCSIYSIGISKCVILAKK